MSESTQREASNQDIAVVLTEEPGCIMQLDITVPAETVKKRYKQAVKRISKEVSLPGFRKGRAPEALLVKNFGSHIEKEWKDQVNEVALQSSIELMDLHPLNSQSLQSLKVHGCSQDEGASLTARVECRPYLPAIDLKVLTPTEGEVREVTDKVMEEAIEDLMGLYTDLTPTADRPAQEGDFLTLNIDECAEEPKRLVTDGRFELAKGRAAQWMLEALEGKNVGDVVETTSRWEESSGGEEKDFTPKELKIEVTKIEEPKKPEDEEALAKRMGVEGAEKMRESIKADLTERFAREAEYESRTKLHDQLLESYSFDLPSSLVETERQVRIRNKIKGLKNQQASRDVILSLEKQIEGLVAQEVDRTLRIFFICQEIAKEIDLKVTQEDLIRLLNHQLTTVPQENRIIEEGMDPKDMRDRLMVQIVTDKVTDHIVSVVNGKAAE